MTSLVERKTLFCTPAFMPPGVDGAERGHFCEECKQEVWLSPTSVAMRAAEPLRLVCLECVPACVAEAESDVTIEEVPGARDELESNLRSRGHEMTEGPDAVIKALEAGLNRWKRSRN